MTAADQQPDTDPAAAAPQPAPLDLDAIDAALAHPLQNRPWRDIVRSLVAEVRRLRAELDAAPAAPRTYELPAEPPPEVTELWGHGTANWFERMPDGWRAKADEYGEYATISWLDLLVTQRRLSTVPPAGTEAQ